MAMMMTGRVLLVCALCVLWCGAGGRCDEGEDTAGSGSGGEHSLASKQLENSSQDTQSLKGGVPGAKGNVPPAPTDEEDDDSDNDEDEGTEVEEKTIGRQGGQGGTTVPGPDSTETNLIGTEQQTGQSIISAEEIPPSGSQEPKVILTQPEVEGKNDTDKSRPAVENALTTVNGENTLPGGVNLPSPPEDGVDSHEQSGEDTTSEDEKNVPSPETAATPQSHRGEGSEGTGEDTKATTLTANTTDTTNTQNSDSSTVKMNEAAPQTTITLTAAQTNHTVTTGNSDGSTAVSHTTSSLLLLLLFACAAAAAVVAA
ncbi:mucin-associated surface protein [Trypanosoma cruzi cruzi]|nr:mucin-associated surface protein [Trypanosoma cruzi cruzi]PWV01025.1 Mucin-associated surface protein (MASP) [Trypanosoma cruzi]